MRHDAEPHLRSREERAGDGTAARAAVPLEAHAEFRVAHGRDPVAVLLGQARTRVPELVPLRHARMLASPFAFYRGAAAVMAADLAVTPTTRLRTQLCGDAHLVNFGTYASPERRLVFDTNDFDETLPGPFEWDVKRLAASMVVAARANGFEAVQCRKVARAAAGEFRTAMVAFAEQSIIDVWYAHVEVEPALAALRASLSKRKRKKDQTEIAAAQRDVAKAHTRDTQQAIAQLTSVVDGRRRIVADPPRVVPLDELADVDGDLVATSLRTLLADYRSSLQSDRRALLDRFAPTDVARKVVGVGSVGLQTWIVLLESGIDGELLLLQAKQAEQSVLAPYAGASRFEREGQRVVAGQHMMQASSDIFLGAARDGMRIGPHDDYYVRQLRDWKLTPPVERMPPSALKIYARLCGWTLARAHARAGDRIAIAAYLGGDATFEHAISEFAETYADRNERDFAAFADAARDGRVEVARSP
jgi:uncharacterized protein (DUF2252 family)